MTDATNPPGTAPSQPTQPVMQTLDPDTIVFTGWDYVASSCWLRLDVAGSTDSSERLYLGTTRHGFLYGTSPENMFPSMGLTPYAEFDTALSDDPEGLMRALMNFWQFGKPDLRSRSSTSQLHPIHHFSDQGELRPNHLRAPVLMEGLEYRVQMDWAIPYCLQRRGGHTAIHPFQLRSSMVDGRLVDRAGDRHWNLPYSVRFRRSENWDHDRSYVTDILRQNGSVYGSVRPRSPTRSDPEWMSVDGVPRPRVRLPHSGGFLLLHKLWLFMVEAYDHIQSFKLAQSNVLRDRYRLRTLRRMFEYTGGSSSNADTRRYVSEAFKLLDTFTSENDEHDRDLERHYTTHGAAVFGYLLDFFGNTNEWGLMETMERDWYSFPQFLGPLTFLELAVWLVRQSPRAEDFYATYGREMLTPPTGTWSSGPEAENPMIPDARFLDDPSPTEFVKSGVSWCKRTLKTYTFVNQIFMGFHTRELWRVASARNMRHAGGARMRMYPSLDELEDFANYVAACDGGEFAHDMRMWLRERGYREGVFHTGAELTRKVRAIRFLHRQEFPKLAGCLDVFGSTLALAALDQAYRETPGAFGSRQAFDAATELLGLVDTTASIAALDHAVFFRVLGKSLAMINVGVSAYDSYRAFVREDYYTGTMRALQAAGASAVLAAGYMGATGGGLAPATVTFIAGTVVVIGADVAIWIDEHRREDHQRYASALFDAICGDPPNVDEWDDLARWPPNRVRRPLVECLDRFALRRQEWGNATVDARALGDLISRGDSWHAFPIARWRYLELHDAASREDYKRYVRSLHSSASSNRAAAPSLPRRIPAPSTLPVVWEDPWFR